jgi:hypothetical protein
VGPALFNATLHRMGGGQLMVQIQTQLEAGSRLVISVEPLRP